MNRLLTVLTLAILGSPTLARAADIGGKEEGSVKESEIRGAVARGLLHIEKEGTWWIDDKKCVSCHHTSFLIWTHREAMRRGFPIEEEKVGKWTKFAFETELSEHKEGGLNGARNLEGLAQMLVMPREESDSEARAQFVKLIVDGQKEDGSWAAGGQLPLQKRPKTETNEVSAFWMTLALESLSEDEKTAIEGEIILTKARKHLKNTKGGSSAEWAMMRALHARNNPSAFKHAIKILRNWQRADGGWNWTGLPVESPSDALATGMALWGLRESNVPTNDPSVQKAIRYLLDTQRPDGTWKVMSTKEAKKKASLDTSVFWGTSWAVIGLLECLPEWEKPGEK